MGLMGLAFLWGFAEATLFFIIPDVLLTTIAIRNIKKALYACLITLMGALLGGTVMYFWGLADAGNAQAIVEKVPAINPEMMAEVKTNLKDEGLLAMILGPTKGIPYKIYAVFSSSLGISYLAFLILSIPARLIRFLVTTLLAWSISKYLLKNVSLKAKYKILAVVWIIIYIIYFILNPS